MKVIGLVYKIPMMHYLGAEGMGYFNSAYELYTLFFVVATAGLPVAVSILISENLAHGRLRNVRKIYKISFALFFALGLVGALVLSVCSGVFAQMLESPKAHLCIAFIAPTVFFVSVASAVRGYFQGNQNMIPTAISQVVEAVGKLALGVLLATWATRQGWAAERAAALAVLGLVAGSAISMLYLLLCGSFRGSVSSPISTDLSQDSTRSILKRLAALAIPVTLGAALSNLTRVVDMTLILRRLSDIGYDNAAATAAFGSYSTLAVPIYHLPSSLIAGVGVSLVPTLTSAVESGSREKQDSLVASAMRLGLFAALPCAFGLTVFSHPILSLLFAGETEAVDFTAPFLAMLGIAVPSACLLTVTTSVLQANKKASLPIFSMLAGTAVKAVSGYILMGIPTVAVMGAPISTLLCNLTTVGLNFYFMERYGTFGHRLLPIFIKPLAPTCLAMAAAVVTYMAAGMRMRETLAFLLALPVCGAVYLVLSLKMGALTDDDVGFIKNKKIKSRIYKERDYHGTQSENKRTSFEGTVSL